MPDHVSALSDSGIDSDLRGTETLSEEPSLIDEQSTTEKTARAVPRETDGEDSSASQDDDETVYVKGHPVIQNGVCCVHSLTRRCPSLT